MNFIKIVIKYILRLISYRSVQKADRFFNILYTHWVKYSFASFGGNSYLERGLRLWNAKFISIGQRVFIRRMGNLSAWDEYMGQQFQPKIEIGDGCSIGEFFNMSCTNSIVLGQNVLIGRWVTLIDHAHGGNGEEELEIPPAERNLVSKGGIVIEDNVWIGDKVTICANVYIHRGAVIGANSVVTKDVAAHTVVAGCPARIIKTALK
ncbi:acyltransferase [Pedobacter sp. AW31-3R]|uniref:acyltransferase n=1 Tax=Pedobacter sp. AW31-3R TaxID=3445781 RepID=UPI003FA08792